MNLIWLQDPDVFSNPLCMCENCHHIGRLMDDFSLIESGFNGLTLEDFRKDKSLRQNSQECGTCGWMLDWEYPSENDPYGVELTWEQWIEAFDLVSYVGQERTPAAFDVHTQIETVLSWSVAHPNCVWVMVDTGDSSAIFAGLREGPLYNRMAYFLAREPYSSTICYTVDEVKWNPPGEEKPNG